MDELDNCADVRDVLPELATGAVSGETRSRALRHINRCPACRTKVLELARTADELLLLAPEREPPAGFESRLLAQLAGDRPRARRGARIARFGLRAAALVLVAALGAGAVLVLTAPVRELGERYQKTLTIAHGQYLRAARITADADADVGQLFAYQGHPSWVLVTVTGAPQPGSYEVRLITKNGSEHVLGTCVATGRTCVAGSTVDVRVANIQLIDLTLADGSRMTARFS
jgi:predicted anti-sigma-YlaC factor YlaD